MKQNKYQNNSWRFVPTKRDKRTMEHPEKTEKTPKNRSSRRYFIRILCIVLAIKFINYIQLDFDHTDLQRYLQSSKSQERAAEAEALQQNFMADFIAGARDYLEWNLTDIPLVIGKKDIFISAIQTSRNFFLSNYEISSSLNYETIAKGILLFYENNQLKLQNVTVIDLYILMHILYDQKHRQDYSNLADENRVSELF